MSVNLEIQNDVDLEIQDHENNMINKSDQAKFSNRTSSEEKKNSLKVVYKQCSNVSFCEEDPIQRQVQQHQLNIHRQNSLRFSNHKKKDDLESKINRM